MGRWHENRTDLRSLRRKAWYQTCATRSRPNTNFLIAPAVPSSIFKMRVGLKRGTVVPTVILDGGPSSHVADTLKSNVVEALGLLI
ncbi:hypothetical protein Pla100_08790 [Neorhodopirellula pilleata]|uniref:Uncharacterized protein n=1 Tax=Neorhodopirellula pilleata TaxID=2714738 RepID=A0A5C6AVE3_9BACT|nr:hypothetical protein Pla100_08790 [Neorhodopirellula pilleata]